MQTSPTVFYRSVLVEGLSIFYREAGRPDAPTLLLLHGFPSSSRMFEPLLTRLSAQYHLVAPDYPGFGHSDAPGSKEFSYTFDHLSQVMQRFTEVLISATVAVARRLASMSLLSNWSRSEMYSSSSNARDVASDEEDPGCRKMSFEFMLAVLTNPLRV